MKIGRVWASTTRVKPPQVRLPASLNQEEETKSSDAAWITRVRLPARTERVRKRDELTRVEGRGEPYPRT
ncbi:hypothetical protein F2Q70_00028706 [Brassica cretica]|uniref:Uncharacterized protein n=1 Tax=Brassica cretica TaxID=69181 RepID=A0A3N6RF05_BRACR|nr:hypothetical protein F2Q70_00028706 [Brassica cretica]KAF3577039.1 hypothetical protein DY000_02035791 [Brassica cretica]